ncbi:YrhK family protein [Sediminibacillus albus]|uniref:YrhK-like protein n=1 Tax=Sediminibacillus albus TaxID=407036 RepID=A0A1G8ZLJ1_9BACI|nr:YrhK family protein [Sediminibacillus albus]SDK15936.1 YrhK-like protein [Sediminibacillus albus]
MPKIKDEKKYVDIQMGKFQLFFNKKYRFISLANDLSLGLWFLIGSILFLFKHTQTIGTIFFILGSAQLLGRPVLKIIHAFYLKKGSS